MAKLFAQLHCCLLIVQSVVGLMACGLALAADEKTSAEQSLQLTQSNDLRISATQQSHLSLSSELEQLYAQGKYEASGTAGLTLLYNGAKPNDDTLLKIGNSLSWTGRNRQAQTVFEMLFGTVHDSAARLALANASRWQGRADLAKPLYNQVLALEPSSKGAKEGLALAERELRPSTTVSLGRAKDSSEMERRSLTVGHRWRDETGSKIYEIETRTWIDRLDPAGLRINASDLTLRFQPLDVKYEPKVYVNASATPSAGLYGGARLKVGDQPTHIYIDRLNWGQAALSARALNAYLSAYHVGIESSHAFSGGLLYGKASAYKVSDNNTVLTSSIKFTPAWRPAGPGIKAYVGVDTRDVKFYTVNYWSPAAGSGTLSGGLMGEWSGPDWFFYASGQLGRPIYGESGNSWSASATGKKWLNKDYALGFNLWGMASVRDGTQYRARAAIVNLEKLW